MHVLLIDVPHDNGVEEYSALTAVCQQRYYAGDATTLSGYGTGIQLVMLSLTLRFCKTSTTAIKLVKF